MEGKYFVHTSLLGSKVEEIVKKKYLNLLIEILLSHSVIVP